MKRKEITLPIYPRLRAWFDAVRDGCGEEKRSLDGSFEEMGGAARRTIFDDDV